MNEEKSHYRLTRQSHRGPGFQHRTGPALEIEGVLRMGPRFLNDPETTHPVTINVDREYLDAAKDHWQWEKHLSPAFQEIEGPFPDSEAVPNGHRIDLRLGSNSRHTLVNIRHLPTLRKMQALPGNSEHAGDIERQIKAVITGTVPESHAVIFGRVPVANPEIERDRRTERSEDHGLTDDQVWTWLP